MSRRYSKRAEGVFLAVVLLFGTAQANAATPLTLSEAWQQALQSNPSLQAGERNVGIAEGERKQAGVLPNPELSWEVEDTRSDTRTTTVQISQPIELGGKRGARIELAERGIDGAAIGQEQLRNELRAEVVAAFQGVLLAQMRQALAEQSQTLSERGVAVVEARVKAGKASALEASRARLQFEEVRLEALRARDQRLNAMSQLLAVIGPQSSAAEWVLGGKAEDLPSLPGEAELLRRLDGVAPMRLAEIEIARQEASVTVEKSQRIPDLIVSLGSQYSSEDRERVNLVGLSMPLPLFDRNQGNVLAASRRADQARDLRNAAYMRLRSEVQQAHQQWRTAQGAIRGFEGGLLRSADAALESTTRGFQMGKFGFIDVLDAQRTLIDVRSRYLQALEEALDAWVRLERIYGDLSVRADSY
ncbi:TolC family protein [Pseudomonas sp. 8Z]|uniref:TolC family protein n=1 Tax=Pseudomonas sp. 8Z TaxID=2653166 RepID=UPI00135BA9B1|nr:TolC family protein [Pseudomonas sp. 8Z]